MVIVAKRGHGEDSIYFDAQNGRWTAAVSLGRGPDGKRRRRKVTAKTRAECAEALRKLHKEIAEGVKTSATYTLAKAVEDWLAEGLDGRSAETVKRNRSILKPILAKIGGTPLRDLTAHQIRAALVTHAKDHASSTIRLIRDNLERAIEHAQANDHVSRNVAALVQPPQGSTGRPSRSLTGAQAASLLQTAKSSRLHAYIVLSLLTGVRTEEARALRWDHVHLDASPPTIDVWRSVRRHGDTKTERSRRTLALPQAAVLALVQRREQQDADRVAAGALWQEHGLAFTTSLGTRLDANNVERDFRAICKAAGLQVRTYVHAPGTECTGSTRHTKCSGEWTLGWMPRELRHSFVSLMSEAGTPVEEISRLVGHGSSRVTETVYRHELRPALTAGAEVMDRIFA
jgi:integrase